MTDIFKNLPIKNLKRGLWFNNKWDYFNRTEWPFLKLEPNETDGEVSRSFRNGHWVRDRLSFKDAALSLAGFQGTQESQTV